MKKFMIIFALVMAFVGGVFGKDVIGTIKHRNDEKFVTAKVYQDELFSGKAHKPISNRDANMIYLDGERIIYATGKVKKGSLVFTVYSAKYGDRPLGQVEFTKVYRKSDDQTRVHIVSDGEDRGTVCYTGDLLKNVVKTELNSYIKDIRDFM